MTQVDQGTIATIDKLKEVPLRTIEALLEGLTKDPANFAVLGLGFIVGYEGIDMMGVLFKPIRDLLSGLPDLAKLASGPIIPQFDLSSVAMNASSMVDLAKIATGGDTGLLGGLFPNRHITPASKNPNLLAPGISYYGAPPVGYTGNWPPYGTTLGKLQDEIDKVSAEKKLKYTFEQWWLEQKVKIVMGCTGAIVAYMLTRPGFVPETLKGLGEITKGIGEIAPL